MKKLLLLAMVLGLLMSGRAFSFPFDKGTGNYGEEVKPFEGPPMANKGTPTPNEGIEDNGKFLDLPKIEVKEWGDHFIAYNHFKARTYHRPGCKEFEKYFSDPRVQIRLSKERAEARGLKPCKVCKP
jgi:hypothetical protein